MSPGRPVLAGALVKLVFWSHVAKSLGKLRLLFARYLRKRLNLLDRWVPLRSFGEQSHEPNLPGVMEPTS